MKTTYLKNVSRDIPGGNDAGTPPNSSSLHHSAVAHRFVTEQQREYNNAAAAASQEQETKHLSQPREETSDWLWDYLSFPQVLGGTLIAAMLVILLWFCW